MDPWLLVIPIAAYGAWLLWKTHMHPAQILARQAANMNWIAAGTLPDNDGYRNVRFLRGNNEAVIWYKRRNVTSLQPYHETPFKDFVELERWLAIEGRRTKIEDGDLLVPHMENRELAIYFIPRPSDPIWKNVTQNNAELIQTGFMDAWRKAGLEKFHNTNDLPKEAVDIVRDVANEVGEPNNLNPAFIILLVHQYVDADQMMRQFHRSHWLAEMVKRVDYAPPPESYVDYIKAMYFGADKDRRVLARK